jgi:hypothetical protein
LNDLCARNTTAPSSSTNVQFAGLPEVHENWTLKKQKEPFPAVDIDAGRRFHWHSFRNYSNIKCLRTDCATNVIMLPAAHEPLMMLVHHARATGEKMRLPSSRSCSKREQKWSSEPGIP